MNRLRTNSRDAPNQAALTSFVPYSGSSLRGFAQPFGNGRAARLHLLDFFSGTPPQDPIQWARPLVTGRGEELMNELNSLEERIKNRRLRRWKRRLRIVAPFAALPVLLCTLVFSIDIIEYSPKPPSQKIVEKKALGQVKRIQPNPAARAAIATSAITQRNVLDVDRVNIPNLETADDEAAASARTGNTLPSEWATRKR